MKIKFVDAAKIRNTIETDFSEWGTHEEYVFIPRGELWVDRFLKSESDLFLALYKLEKKMKEAPYEAFRLEASKLFTKKMPDGPRTVKVCECDGLRIRYVDGRDVRRGLDPNFLLGGHGLVYSYIPKREIWVDAHSNPKEWQYTIAHEMTERGLMAQGRTYADAHDFAIAAERSLRRKNKDAHFLRR